MVTTKSYTTVGVSVWARAVTHTANEVVRILLEIPSRRGLSVEHVHERLEFLLKSFRTWMALHALESAVLEIYDPNSDQLVERYDLVIDYERNHDESEHFETAIERVREALGGESLDGNLRYRVIVSLLEGAPELPGWSPTNFRNKDHLERQRLNNVSGNARIGVDLEYWS